MESISYDNSSIEKKAYDAMKRLMYGKNGQTEKFYYIIGKQSRFD